MKYKCFLIVPIYGDAHPEDETWPPYKIIKGWVREDTGEWHENNSRFGIGAMWFSLWLPKNWEWENETEPHLHVRCPNGDSTRDWDIDSRASNCTLIGDKLHRCWVRHGIPPEITVDKKGESCAAGAGSIQLPKWHGFLTNGYLSESR